MGLERLVIGMLSDITESGKRNVFINKGNAIQYLVKPLIANEELPEQFTGYINSFIDDIEDDLYAADDDRIDHFYNEVANKLFVFSYIPGYDNDYPKMRDVSLVPKHDSFDKNTRFVALPVFAPADDEMVKEWEDDYNWRLHRDFKTVEEFSNHIKNKKPLGSIYKFYPENTPSSFVIWKEYDGRLYAFGKVDNISKDVLGGLIIESSGSFKFDISNYMKNIVYNPMINPTVLFITDDMYEIIADEFIKRGNELEEELAKDNIDKIVENKESDETEEASSFDISNNLSQQDIDENNSIIKSDGSTEEVIEIDKQSTKQLEKIKTDKVDSTIIEYMEYHGQNNNLFYSKNDLINLHTSIKCSNLTILSGLSGTGKTQIVDVYAKALGINSSNSDDSRLLYVPVRPSWNDDSDLLGYVDLVHMVYRPSDTGFVDFLVKAQKNDENKNKLYIVCFDEMNLARVEHYFSQFLSILERPESQRELILYDKQYRGRLYNSTDYPDRITIGDNIKFVGTVNIDETTYHFSDKVLDRANIISLDILNYSKEWTKKQFGTQSNIVWTNKEYRNLIKKPVESDYKQIREFLWDLHTVLRYASEKFGVGPRIVKAIENYLTNIPDGFEKFDKKIGLDYQVLQRVLTKVRGPENQLGDILRDNNDMNLISVFDKYQNLSDFTMSREAIAQKQKELNTYGYCI